jgi:DNA-binding transcriptional ArsR family regulator
MAEFQDELAAIDRTIHEPARLAILTALSAVASADFLFLQQLIGLTPGNLSSHLSRLEEAGLIWVKKEIRSKRTHTEVGLSERGRLAIQRHWDQLAALRERAQKAAGPPSSYR